jgi:hypothetical protein
MACPFTCHHQQASSVPALDHYVSANLGVVDFAIFKFPPRAAFEDLMRAQIVQMRMVSMSSDVHSDGPAAL